MRRIYYSVSRRLLWGMDLADWASARSNAVSGPACIPIIIAIITKESSNVRDVWMTYVSAQDRLQAFTHIALYCPVGGVRGGQGIFGTRYILLHYRP